MEKSQPESFVIGTNGFGGLRKNERVERMIFWVLDWVNRWRVMPLVKSGNKGSNVNLALSEKLFWVYHPLGWHKGCS